MRIFILTIIINLHCIACVSEHNINENQNSGLTPIIVAFEHNIEDPNSPELIKFLTNQLDCKLDYSHELSNNAYLYKAYTQLNDKEFESKLKHLATHDDIKYAEKDKRVKNH